MTRIRLELSRLWRASRLLTALGLGMLAIFGVTLVALAVDGRVVGGAPAWLKPAKFALSFAIYALTLAWIFTYLEGWPRLRAVAGLTTAAVLLIEVVLIGLQAARGLTSHFNIATPFDARVYAVMGIAIGVAWAISLLVTIALFRQRFADPALGWAIRLGLLITVFGSAAGGLMTAPTAAQLDSARAGHRMTIVGAHTVGAPDAAPGLPGTGWSRTHGDLRVPHFLGLHGAQAIPLLAWLLRRVRPAARRQRAVLVAAASYASLVLILLWQALAGQPLTAPHGPIAAALVAWGAATVLAMRRHLQSARGNGTIDVPYDSPGRI